MSFEDASILVVDDEPALCKIFAGWLQRAGCGHVRTAGNGEEAVALLKAETVDLLITDVRMPKMDGITLVRYLRTSAQPAPIILFVSGFGDVDHREMYALGVEAFLAKPLSREDFVSQARRALTDKEHLLSTPLTDKPRQSLVIEGATLSRDPKSENRSWAKTTSTIRMGRGGFAVHHAVPLTLGNISFLIYFQDEALQLTGHGYVRWYDRAEQTFGLELAFLTEPGRTWFLNSLQSNRYDCFIPDSSVPAIAEAYSTSANAGRLRSSS